MDIYCPRCGEPWDHDTLHEEVELRMKAANFTPPNGKYWSGDDKLYADEFKAVSADFRKNGCAALHEFTGNMEPCQPRNNDTTAIASAMYDIMGDDLDGAAAMFEDAEYMGLMNDGS